MSAPRVGMQLLAAEVPCPTCGRLEVIAVELAAVLTVPDDGVATLRVKAKSKALDHWCTSATTDTVGSLFDTADGEP